MSKPVITQNRRFLGSLFLLSFGSLVENPEEVVPKNPNTLCSILHDGHVLNDGRLQIVQKYIEEQENQKALELETEHSQEQVKISSYHRCLYGTYLFSHKERVPEAKGTASLGI